MEENNSEKKKTGSPTKYIVYLTLLSVALLVATSLLGWQVWQYSNELEVKQRQYESTQTLYLRTEIQGLLASAVVEARTGAFEQALTNASDFYTKLRTEADKDSSSAYSSEEIEKIKIILGNRDRMIAMLAQKKETSASILTNTYISFLKMTGVERQGPIADDTETKSEIDDAATKTPDPEKDASPSPMQSPSPSPETKVETDGKKQKDEAANSNVATPKQTVKDAGIL